MLTYLTHLTMVFDSNVPREGKVYLLIHMYLCFCLTDTWHFLISIYIYIYIYIQVSVYDRKSLYFRICFCWMFTFLLYLCFIPTRTCHLAKQNCTECVRPWILAPYWHAENS